MVKGKKSGNSVDFTVFFFTVLYLRFHVKSTLQKRPAPFLPFFGKSAKKSAADFLGPGDFSVAAFCGRNFSRLATLSMSRIF
jgi:hypothetical protein